MCNRCFTVLLLGSMTASLPAQVVDANMSHFGGTMGVLVVGGQMLTKDAGYFTTSPTARAGRPDFRTSSLLQGANVVIDAFSIGEDWITANEIGECLAPPGRWSALLFSVTSTSQGALGSQIALERAGPGGVGGDMLCYEFQDSGVPGMPFDGVYRALNSSDILLANGVELSDFDWFAARYGFQGIEPPKELKAYFSVTATSATNIPSSWGGMGARNGTTVFQTTWNGTKGAWSTPSVYLSAADLQTSSDVDALAVDATHHMNEYVLFSTVASGGGPQLRFYNRGTGQWFPYRFAGGGPTVESKMGLVPNDDIDGLCADDPGYVNNNHTWTTHARPITSPLGWQPQGNISVTLDRRPAPNQGQFYGFSASPTASATHEWWMCVPPGSPQLIGPVTRSPAWHGQPSFLTWSLSTPAMLGQQIAFGVSENFSYYSQLVQIQEWRELEKTVTAVDRFADTEGVGSNTAWTNGPNRLQCVYDSSHFTRQGIDHPIVINELAWRQYRAGGPTVTWPYVNVYVGYAANPYSSINTSFAANRVVTSPSPNFSGPVTMTPVAGTQPNAPSIRVVLTTPFQYDYTQGQGLLVELEFLTGPTPSTTTLTCASYGVAGVTPDYRASAVRSTVLASSSGTVIPDVPVVEFGYVDPTNVATTTAYGDGCYKTSRTFYERFHSGAFDLGPLPGTSVNSLRLTPSGGGYSVSAGSNGWWTPSGTGLAMVDDDTRVINLPQTFNTPLGPTTQFIIYSNGFVLPWGSTYVYGEPPTAEDLVNGPPRYAVCWGDLLPDGATNINNVFANWDAPSSTYYVTWRNVGTWSPVSGTVTAQIAFNMQNGNVEYRWQTCRLPVPSMVGWSPGGNAYDPGGSDLSFPVLATGSDNPGLQLTASPRALITTPSTTVNFTVTSNPAAALFIHIMALPSATNQPSIELGFLGLPNCYLHVDLSASAWYTYTLSSGSSATLPFVIPQNTSLTGVQLHHQAVGFNTSVNAFGALTSNALLMTLGLQ